MLLQGDQTVAVGTTKDEIKIHFRLYTCGNNTRDNFSEHCCPRQFLTDTI